MEASWAPFQTGITIHQPPQFSGQRGEDLLGIELEPLRLPLSRPPRFGCFLWWPVPGVDWIHDDDRFVAERLIPGGRIFCRRDEQVGFAEYRYGRHSFRAKPAMWTEVPEPSIRLGDWVEVRSRMGRNEPLVALVREVFWERSKQRARFQLSIAGRRLVRLFDADELALTARLGEADSSARRWGELRPGGYLSTFVPGEADAGELELAPQAKHSASKQG